MRYWRVWFWNRLKIISGLLLVLMVGGFPALLVDRWLVPLSTTISTVGTLLGAWVLLSWLDFEGVVRRYKEAEQVLKQSTRRVYSDENRA